MLYRDLYPERLNEELALAARLGVRACRVGSPEFDAAIQLGPIKWVVTRDWELLCIPQAVHGREVMHPIMAHGQDVRAAGRALVDGAEGRYVLLELNNWSNHYQPPAESLAIGVDAFERAGIPVLPQAVHVRTAFDHV